MNASPDWLYMREVSIRALSRRHCDTCKTDTLHRSMVCIHCDALNLCGAGARLAAEARIRAKYMVKGMSGREAYQAIYERLGRQRAKHLKESGQRFKDIPLRRGERNY